MFEVLPHLAPDPILGLSAAYREDTNPNKIDLGVGVYKTEEGDTPILSCVKKAEQFRLENETSKSSLYKKRQKCQEPCDCHETHTHGALKEITCQLSR